VEAVKLSDTQKMRADVVGFDLRSEFVVQQASAELVLLGEFCEIVLVEVGEARAEMSEMRVAACFREVAPAIVIVVAANAGGVFRFVFEVFLEIALEEVLDGHSRRLCRHANGD